MQMSGATKGLEAKYTALESEIRSTKWMIGSIGALLAIIGLAPLLAKMF